MGNFNRCRKIYEKIVENFASDSESWIKFSEFEEELNEIERSREIYERALKFKLLENPEEIWKKFIDFEVRNGNTKKWRDLYERLLSITKHVKVFISYALTEFEQGNFEEMRNIFEKGNFYFKSKKEFNEERSFLLENWLQCE